MYSELKGRSSYGMSLNRHAFSSDEEYNENGEFNKKQAHAKTYNASSREGDQESSGNWQSRAYVENFDGDDEIEDEFPEDVSSQKRDHKIACETFVYFSKSSDIYSQWYASKFTIDDQEFNCGQQFMTYRKAVLFEDLEIAGEVLKCTDPGRIREIGKKVKGFDLNTWKQNCIQIAKEGNRAKFSQNKKILEELIATHPKILVEASPSNKTWGIGLKETSPRAWDESTWKGKNYLGYVLTEVRDDILVERGTIDGRGRKMYTDKLSKDAANPNTRERRGTRGHKYDSNKHENYLYFESGIYSMSRRSDFWSDGQIFRSVQQYLMFKKAELFKDFEKAEEILTSVDPKFLQQKGREVKGFKEDVWKSHRLQIAKDGNMAKFSQNEDLRSQIILTHPKKFVMASPIGKIWGIGLAEQDPKSRDKNVWNGKNDLGNVLTEVRNTLSSEYAQADQRERRTNEGDTSD
ncbi:uncharacterized protein LOC123537288 [Mercenaria mercenaria]|uniref:uncharacterized protein LOC123537288 n=1 Tax=Mercenaria mercenaria TaxID=6596 RepID=UPI00234F7B06|nr:uncharacterized protein LOC123537288 [Mercenaria mercenaria]